MKPIAHLNQSIYSTAFTVFVFLVPLFFLPITSNFFDTNKLALVLIFALYTLIAWAIHLVATRSFKLTLIPASGALFVFGAAYLISSFINGTTPYNHLIGKGSLIPALTIITLLAPTLLISQAFITRSLYALMGSAAILSIIGIFQSLGFGLSNLINRILNTNLPNTLAFTPAGSALAMLTFIAPIIIATIALALVKKESLEKAVFFLVSAIMTSGFVLTLIYAFPGKDTAPLFLPPSDGYSIMLETLKEPKRAIFGFGPESFVVAYNRLRPAAINLTKFWNVRFDNSSNEVFNITTTTGLLGLISLVVLSLTLIKVSHISLGSVKNVIKVATFFSLLLLLLVPATYLHFFLLFILITLWGAGLKFQNKGVREIDTDLSGITLVRPDSEGHRTQSQLNILPYIAAFPLIALAVLIGYYTSIVYLSDLTFKKSLDAAAKNQGVETYNAQRDAIAAFGFVPRYRRAYAATNLALANSLAGKKDLTDKDKQDITQLIQQAIREAKAAVTLDPDSAVNWENLTFVYKSLIGIAQNADQWTIAAIAQAIKNDPVNPRLRLELGGVYYTLNRYDQAIRFYQQATELKPDWANAYYNLSAAHKQKNELTQAYDYLRQVIALVEPNTADYTKVQTEIQDLASQLKIKADAETQTLAPQGDLNIPAPVPTTRPADQVQLPESEGPAEIAPSPAEVSGEGGPTPTATP